MGHGIPDLRAAFKILAESGAGHWEEDAAPDALLLFPNPTSSGTVRWIYSGNETPSGWCIYDMNGREIAAGHAAQWTTWNGHHQGWFSLDKLGAGHYLVQLLAANKVLITEPLVVHQ